MSADNLTVTSFSSYPPSVRRRLLELRGLILDVAGRILEVGPLIETLKWGQPSFLPAKSRTGTTVRIDQVKGDPGKYAIYVHCQTNLIETFRERYPDRLTFDGNRAIVFEVADTIPVEIVSEFIEAALTYHLKRA